MYHIIEVVGKGIHSNNKFYYLGYILEIIDSNELTIEIIHKIFDYRKNNNKCIKLFKNNELDQIEKITTDINELNELKYILR